jgi:hypothetical protein
MNRTIPTECPVFGDEAPVHHDDTVISLTPHPHLAWICPNCGDMHSWSLTPAGYDWLQSQQYDVAAALNGKPIFVSQKQSL